MYCDRDESQQSTDATKVPLCYRPQPDPSLPSSTNCGCPVKDAACWDCRLSCPVETHFFKRPRRVEKSCRCFTIPAISVVEAKEERRLPGDPLCFDWTVNEPGPNDSYGKNGLNCYDWEMEEITKYAMQVPTKGYTPSHPGYSNVQAPSATPIYQCRLPIECYARFPGPCKTSPFVKSVNYFRDFRCCKSKPPPPWKPPYAQWATNQHL
ncbi:hypothetical protein RRG08_048821 [Elysia crispata]|uniref:Uncharacterized protein n=1 Tax=Elysia crispata TaxID=231223 RepID=A0AAE1B3Q6_9GAST|nr:hypothetical protein RRG08_048821 [Elysia crispata]